MKKAWVGFAVACGLLGGIASAQSNSVGDVYTPQANGLASEQPLYSGSYALVIGVADYVHWSRLGGAIRDANTVSEVLKRHGFKVTQVSNPNYAQLEAAFTEFMTKQGQDRNARVLVYFAGHGHSMPAAYGDKMEGYIVPVDAPLADEQSPGAFIGKALSMERLRDISTKLRAKHALFVFDSCFAGTIFSARSSMERSDFISDMARRPARIFITAGDAEQKVPDESNFRRYFVNGLEDGDADLNGDGYITGMELGLYLRQQVTSLGRGNKRAQSPLVGPIDDPALSRGDFIFNSPKGGRDGEPEAWKAAERAHTLGAYQMYLRQFPTGRHAKAAQVAIEGLKPVPVVVSAPALRAEPTPAPPPAPTVPVQGQTARECIQNGLICFELAAIPTGSFQMGSPDTEQDRSSAEGPVHTVGVQGFWMGKTEVTQGLWKAVMGSNPSQFSSCGDNCPLENVNWIDVQDFIKKLNGLTGKKYRLPSEAEWEYAARAGTKTRWSFGDQESQLGEYAWYVANSDSRIHEVARKKPNPWGLYDMHGNAWEWVKSNWRSNYKEGNHDIFQAEVLRGGSWGNDPRILRSAFRLLNLSLGHTGFAGFRLARDN